MRLLPLLFLVMLTSCAGGIGLPSLGWFPGTVDNKTLHEEVFREAYRRINEYALEPVSYRYAVKDGLDALKTLDPNINSKIENPPAAEDWKAWSSLTYRTIKQSPTLAGSPPEPIYQAFFAGFFTDMDGFSHYLPPEEAQAMQEWKDGYGGIGVTFERRKDEVVVVDVFVGSPADKAGIKAGEKIIALDGQPVLPLTAKEFANKVRGPIGSVLTLSLSDAQGQVRDISLKRARVQPTTIALTREGEVAIIRISRFMPGTVNEFRRAARQVVWSKAKAVILDLRHNPGGILETATTIAAMLVPKGVVAQTTGRHPRAASDFRSSGSDVLARLPLYVLIDAQTASAAETLSAALQDRGRAMLIGSTSFGKGSVQTVGPLPHGGELAVTWARLVAPSGYSYMRQGVQPDVCLSQPELTFEAAILNATAGSARLPILDLQRQADADETVIKRLLAHCPRASNLDNLALPVALKLAENR